MNKFYFIFFTSLACIIHESTAQILIGPVANANIGWPVYKDKEIKDRLNIGAGYGYNFGASVSFRVQKRFFLQTSVLYSRKVKTLTEKKVDSFYDADFSNKLKLNYIEIPLLYTAEFKGKLGKKSNKEFKWYLGVGPTVSYWLGGKGELTDGDLIEINVGSLPYKVVFDKNQEDVKQGEMNVNNPNRIQLALNASAGLILEPVGFNKIMVAVRYEFGHSYLSPDSDGYFGGFDGDLYYQDELQIRMHTLNLSLQYFIDLKTDQRNKGKSTIKTKNGRLKK
ncbi:MAG TPA: porin family protein [Cyclobacteriaceae bacterium]|nr:porin family protein [Cyclobacteriaceae bacterium]